MALVVPSLVNRADILDLMPDRSLLRFLGAGGIRPLLLDWGWPGADERRFGLAKYIDGPLAEAMAVAAEHADAAGAGRPALVGYCMGGTLAVAAAQRRPHLLGALALLATPWDFHAGAPAGADAASTMDAVLAAAEPAMALTGALSIDALQTMFASVDPGAVARKYRVFGALDQASDQATRFVALEDWLNDGVPLAAPVAREVLSGWYGRNAPVRGEWKVNGDAIEPSRLRLPSFVAIPTRDRIVPPASARALASALRGALVHAPDGGHVGMVAGQNAEALLWRPLRDWLLANAHAPSATQKRRARLPRKRAEA